jgi:hypothetical protein
MHATLVLDTEFFKVFLLSNIYHKFQTIRFSIKTKTPSPPEEKRYLYLANHNVKVSSEINTVPVTIF